jgi:hypothetical protein
MPHPKKNSFTLTMAVSKLTKEALQRQQAAERKATDIPQ